MRIEILLTLSKTEANNFVRRPINGSGGFQTLLKRVCQNYDVASRTLRISLKDALKIKYYATKFGQGGFQDRLLPIVTACNELSQILQDIKLK